MTDNCIHCGLCTQKCPFLQKYSLDLEAFSRRPDLAYHCFLCGECARVCPRDIDGRALSLTMRRTQTAENRNKLKEKGYRALIAEKQNYPFRNYRRSNTDTALFPGCNFPSFFPETTDTLVHLLKSTGIGVVYDCCGKPISDLGMAHREMLGTASLQKRLRDAGIHRLAVLCPNCYYYLKNHISVEVISIYELLRELNLGKTLSEEITLFPPCPDRDEPILLEQIRYFVPHAQPISDTACCGLGGCAAGKEPEIAASFARQFNDHHSTVYTYCASCAGQLRRGGTEHTTHVLTSILGTDEKPALSSVQSFWNRAKRIF